MSSSNVQTDFAFTESAINAAMKAATAIGLRLDKTLDMEAILRAAWIEQQQGDFNVANGRKLAQTLQIEIEELQEKAVEARKQWAIEQDELRTLGDIHRAIRLLLHATKKQHKQHKRYVQAWDLLSEWAS